MTSPLREHAAKIHADAMAAVAMVYDGIDEDRRIMWVQQVGEFLFVTHRERNEDTVPVWDVFIYREWIGASGRGNALVAASAWPLTAKLEFLEIAVHFRVAYLQEIERYEALAAKRYG